MDERILELKRLKRRCRRDKRKYVTGWKTAAIIFLIAALIFTPVSLALQVFDNAAQAIFGGSFWRLAGRDESANYFPHTPQQLSSQAQTEGMVLLKNENGALPLQDGTQLLCYGADALAEALAARGFAVNTGAAAEKTVLLLNDQKPVQPELLAGVDAVLWCGGSDADAVAAVLAGINPAGSLASTLCYTGSSARVDGSEGIYVGYKYYQTRYEDFVMGTGNAGDYIYQNEVAYPFGFGVGYTTFSYTDMAVLCSDETDTFAVTVTVTNTGTVPGRETVQVYAQSPYTDYDKQMGVEKTAVNLVGFAKTAQLEPGGSEKVTVIVDKRELTSYDAYGAGTYILEAGNYYLTVATDAHDAVNNILAAKGYTPESTAGRMDGAGNTALTYQWVQEHLDDKTYAAAKNGTAIVNRLTAADSNLSVTWLSRQDWIATLAKPAVTVSDAKPPIQYDPGDYATVAMPTLGAKNGLRLYDVIGLPFEDAKWQTLLDQLTFWEMAELIGDAYRWMMPVRSLQAPGARQGEMALPISEALLANTFDTALLYEAGKIAGSTALSAGETVLHCFGGSFEDGFLTGKLRAAQVRGMREQGIIALLKQSTQAWCNEQTAREQYLRGFRYAVEENPTTGIAVSHAEEGLLTGILRQEWGGKGMAVSRNVSAATGVLAGITAVDGRLPEAVTDLLAYQDDPVIVSAMRQACHYHLYTLANAAAMNGIGADTTVKVQLLPVVTVCLLVAAVSFVAFVVFAALWHRGKKKWKKTESYLNYKTLQTTLKAEQKRYK